MTITSPTTEAVVNHYSSIARDRGEKDIPHAKKVAQAFGYSLEDLASTPDGANMGLSCGNPLATASLKPGDVVVDLGCGAGFDIFQASRAVGAQGLAIGIDMSADMLQRAETNAAKTSLTNTKFVLAPITATTLEPNSADCIISNCVINLLPDADKAECFREIFRVLKPGGRLAISDTLAKKPIPNELRSNIGLFVGCISGASLVGTYEKWLKEAGFQDILPVDKNVDLNIYKGNSQRGECCPAVSSNHESTAASCCQPPSSNSECTTSSCSITTKQKPSEDADESKSSDGPNNIDFNEWASSYGIYAVKPST